MANPQNSLQLLLKLAELGILGIFLSACGPARSSPAPSIRFIRVPRADDGGTDSRAVVEGRVDGARTGDQIVLFAKSGAGIWWVQPFADQPFTAIQSDSKWRSSTHLGTEYAALLVGPGYRPPETTDQLPLKGGPVLAVASVKGSIPERPVSRTLHFSGYEWEARSVPSNRGGATNNYDPANAWTDIDGRLHLRIARGSGEWTCAEVALTRSLGYGSYMFHVGDVSGMEPAAVLGMFTWDDSPADPNHRELDIEVSRWGEPEDKNVQYVIQPYFVPANVVRFAAPSGRLTESFQWEPGRVDFRTARADGSLVSEHVFTSGVPAPGGESVHLNLYVFANKKTPMQHEAEVVIEKFEYLP